MTFHPGSRLGRYELQAPVGSGGFGDVFRAFDTLLRRDVAIKALRPRSESDDSISESVHRSLREARSASALNHPGIVTIHDVGEHDSRAFIVMEWVDGQTLRQELR